MDHASTKHFRAVAVARSRGGITVRIPFDPWPSWGALDAYHVKGTVAGQPFRGALSGDDGGWSLQLGPAWCRRPGFEPGDEVEVMMVPEGPRSSTMGADVVAAFVAEPAAARFFDSLPTFYRNNLARWVAGAKRSETRARAASPNWSTLRNRASVSADADRSHGPTIGFNPCP
jgi:hypothetical protein